MKKLRVIGIIGLLTVLMLVISACGGKSESKTSNVETNSGGSWQELPRNGDGYVDISVDQLAQAMQEKDFTLVNVHIPYGGELPNTDLFIPFNQIGDNLDKLPSKDQPIVLYCAGGGMSTMAAKELASRGYTNVYEVDGGFSAWRAAGYELLVNQ
jgi:rhodanese-related sulfurtransferase